jgi:hypothetical protein
VHAVDIADELVAAVAGLPGGHEARSTTFGNSSFPNPAEPLASHAIVVDHEEQALSDVRRPDARSA